MEIGLDISITQTNRAGTSIYVENLVAAFTKITPPLPLKIFHITRHRGLAKQSAIVSRLQTIYRDIIWTHSVLPWKVYRSGIDVLHMPANIIPLVTTCPTIVTILDATVFHTPEYFTSWHRNYYQRLIPVSARKSCRIITISEHSKRDIIKYTGIDKDKIVVTYLAASPKFRPISQQKIQQVKQRYNLGPFILTVGTLEPRKNIIRLLHAFSKLQRKGLRYSLIHVGPQGWLYTDVLTEVQTLGLQDVVHFLDRIPLDDLVALYNAASVFVYPSLYEGFGLPVVEAMACGCPVITSDTSSLPEIAGSAALLVNPTSVEQLTTALEQVLIDRQIAGEMSSQGLIQAANFSWERCAQATAAVYRQIAN